MTQPDPATEAVKLLAVDALAFLGTAFRNVNLPRLSRADVADVQQALDELVRGASSDKLAEVEAERDEARAIVRDIHWMARRYADGRQSYAVGMFNDAIRKAFDARWLDHKLTDEPQYARDSMFSPEWRSIEHRTLAAEARCDALQLKLDEAKAVIEPFANLAEIGLLRVRMPPEQERLWSYYDSRSDTQYEITRAHLVAARDFLARTTKEER